MSPDTEKELLADVKELVKQGVVHNELLRTHEARSLALQQEQKVQAAAINRIDKHVFVVNILLGAAGTLSLAVLCKLALSALGLL